MSIALACNVYQDAFALRGLLESGARYFDNLFVIHSGPGGAHSTDGTIELVEKSGATLVFDDMDKGFGVIRSRLIHDCGCEWAWILDADERFHPQLHVLHCHGTESYPAVASPNLKVTELPDVIDQGAHVKNLITNPMTMAIRATRRHWFDWTMRRPTQNWFGPDGNKDHQLRIVRNSAEISYASDIKMHERLQDSRTGRDPHFATQDENGGPFIDHYHMAFRTAYPGTKERNEVNYARLSRGEKMTI